MKVYRLFKSFSENEKPRVYIHRLYDASLVLANNAFGQTYIDFYTAGPTFDVAGKT